MKIVFYAYGNHQIGMGHIYRSMALAKAFKKKLKAAPSITFLSIDYQEGIKKIQGVGYPIHKIPVGLPEQEEIEYCSNILTPLHPDVFVVDALWVSPAEMGLFKDCSKYLVSIDDTKDGRLFADLVINVLYQSSTKNDDVLELTDLKYCILGEEYSAYNRPPVTIRPIVKRILVTQGGSDTYGVTVRIARALDRLDKNIAIVLLLGPAFKHDKELQTVLQKSKRDFIVEKDVQDVVSLFTRCDLAVTGAGLTLFELAALGIPCIVLTQEEKEIETANRLKGYGFIKSLGLSENISDEDIYGAVNTLIEDYPLRKQMHQKSRELIDGRGAERVVEVILDRLGGRR